jgi:hypothetical protein
MWWLHFFQPKAFTHGFHHISNLNGEDNEHRGTHKNIKGEILIIVFNRLIKHATKEEGRRKTKNPLGKS